MKKLKHLYKDNIFIVLGCLIAVPLALGMFVNAPWLLIVLDVIGLFAGIKLTALATCMRLNKNDMPWDILPERVMFNCQVYYRQVFHQVRYNDSYWGIEYKNQYDEFLPHLEDTFTTVDFNNIKISLESLINIVHYKLKEYNYV